MPQFELRYEATAFTNNKSLDGAELTEEEGLGFTETSLEEESFPSGVVAVLRGHIALDDDQGEDAKVFVSVTLVVEADDEDEAEAFEPPEDLLATIADMMANTRPECSFDLEAHSWELIDIDEADES